MKNFLLIFCLFSVNHVYCEDEKLLFESANNDYYNNNYCAAIEKYEQLIMSGNGSSEVFFNLGNAYFKQNHIGKSILNLERSKMIKPLDKETINNLQFVKTQAGIPTDCDLIKKTLNELSYNTWVVLLSIFILSVICLIFFPRLYFWGISLRNGLWALILLFLFVSIAGVVATKKNFSKSIIIEQCEMTVSPISNSDVIHTMSSGESCEIISEHGNFLRIKTTNKFVGWIPKGKCEKVIPN